MISDLLLLRHEHNKEQNSQNKHRRLQDYFKA